MEPQKGTRRHAKVQVKMDQKTRVLNIVMVRTRKGSARQVIGQGSNMRRPIIAGNWKMYKTIPEALDFVRAFKPLVVASTHCEIVIAPAFTAIKTVVGPA